MDKNPRTGKVRKVVKWTAIGTGAAFGTLFTIGLVGSIVAPLPEESTVTRDPRPVAAAETQSPASAGEQVADTEDTPGPEVKEVPEPTTVPEQVSPMIGVCDAIWEDVKQANRQGVGVHEFYSSVGNRESLRERVNETAPDTFKGSDFALAYSGLGASGAQDTLDFVLAVNDQATLCLDPDSGWTP